jgi:AraC family transcriptional regulator
MDWPILRISEKTQPGTAGIYVQRVNFAIDHIVGHLREPLRLKKLARVAMLSPFHFGIKAWREAHGMKLDAIVEQAAKVAHLDRLPARDNPDSFRVKIRDLPSRTVAYIRVDKPYKGNRVMKAFETLFAWAQRNGFADGQWLGYRWDDPEITSLEYCRYYVAVESERFSPKGQVARYHFPPMTVAEVAIRGGLDLELRALRWLYGSWIRRSGYVPDDHPCFEAWIGRPFAHGIEHFELLVQLPIRRLSRRSRG